jgi:hypothetical protein
MSHWISRHDTAEFDRRLLQMLWTNKSMVDTNFCASATPLAFVFQPPYVRCTYRGMIGKPHTVGGSVNTSGFCLGCGFLCHSINIKRAREQSGTSKHFVLTPLLQFLGIAAQA